MIAPIVAPAWNAWHGRQAVALAPLHERGYVRIRLAPAIDPGAGATYDDLRVVDDRSREIAYVLDPETHRLPSAPRALPVSDAGFVRGAYTQVVADAGTDGTLHGALAFETSEPSFFLKAAIDASDDRRVWREVRRDALVYRVPGASAGDTTVRFAPTRSRWLRLRIAQPEHPFPIGAVRLTSSEPAASPGLAPLPAQAQAQPRADHTERWLFDASVPRAGATAVRFTSASAAFQRTVTIEASDDDVQWREAGIGTIQRFADGAAQTSFTFGEDHARYWRVSVDDGNDLPVPGLRPELLARSRDVLIAAEPGRRYTLLFANPTADAPVYDLGARLEREDWHAVATVGASEEYTYVGPLPSGYGPPPATPAPSVFARYPWLLDAAFLLVAGALVLLALRTLRTAPATETDVVP